ncbi:hypothetical protein AB0M43_34945 [Longispora sp. NPDC051575]|uniref:hypothetical protein n=1 Tax=Longispora sp. NPDC051575 TaxID=3154943 RepID=UPI0034253108
MTTILLFPLDAVLRLAEHAAAAPEHEHFPTQVIDGQPPSPCLVWVHDSGTYLMSNGIPGSKMDPPDQPGAFDHVHAEGYGPCRSPRESVAAADLVFDKDGRLEIPDPGELGGDDFAEPIDLTEPHGRTPTLLRAIRAAHRIGRPHLALTVTAETYAISFPEATETGR